MSRSCNPFLIDYTASYTFDESVAYLLGTLKSGVLKRYIAVEADGVPYEDLLEISRLTCPLEDHLMDLLNAATSDDQIEIVMKWLHASSLYSRYLKDEILKGELSSIRIDPEATEQTGVAHYTVASLEEWFEHKQEFFKSKLNPDRKQDVPNASNEYQDSNTKQSKNGLSPTAAENLYLTLGLFVHEFAARFAAYRHDKSGGPKVDVIAGKIAEHTEQTWPNEILKGQSKESIKNRIEAALKLLPKPAVKKTI